MLGKAGNALKDISKTGLSWAGKNLSKAVNKIFGKTTVTGLSKYITPERRTSSILGSLYNEAQAMAEARGEATFTNPLQHNTGSYYADNPDFTTLYQLTNNKTGKIRLLTQEQIEKFWKIRQADKTIRRGQSTGKDAIFSKGKGMYPLVWDTSSRVVKTEDLPNLTKWMEYEDLEKYFIPQLTHDTALANKSDLTTVVRNRWFAIYEEMLKNGKVSKKDFPTQEHFLQRVLGHSTTAFESSYKLSDPAKYEESLSFAKILNDEYLKMFHPEIKLGDKISLYRSDWKHDFLENHPYSPAGYYGLDRIMAYNYGQLGTKSGGTRYRLDVDPRELMHVLPMGGLPDEFAQFIPQSIIDKGVLRKFPGLDASLSDRFIRQYSRGFPLQNYYRLQGISANNLKLSETERQQFEDFANLSRIVFESGIRVTDSGVSFENSPYETMKLLSRYLTSRTTSKDLSTWMNILKQKTGQDLLIPKWKTTKKADGGYISGPGGPRADLIPAMLSNGEYVIQSSAVSKYGQSMLDAINGGNFGPKYATGGIIKSYSVGGSTNDSSISLPAPQYNVNIVVNGANASADDIADMVATRFRRETESMSTGRSLRA